MNTLVCNKKKRLAKSLLYIFVVFFLHHASGTEHPVLAFQNQVKTVLNWGELQHNIQILNPLELGTTEEHILRQLIFGEPLFYYDPYDDEIKPGIVEYWGVVSPDPNIWILSIKEKIVFQDGSPVQPEDIQFSMNIYKQFVSEFNLPYNPHLDKLKEIQIIGPRILQLYLQDTIEDLPVMLADIPVLPRAYYEGETFEQTIQNINEKKPLGYGPFRLSSIIPQNQIVLERHYNYHNDLPGFTRVNLKLYESIDLIKSDFITGQLDFIQLFDIADKREITGADTIFSIIKVPTQTFTTYTINLNYNYSLLSSRNVREALQKALNRNRYPMSNVQFDVRSVAFGPVPRSSFAFFKNLERFVYNPLSAKRDLSRIGWRDNDRDGIIEQRGNNFTLELLYPEWEVYLRNLIQYIRIDLSEVGVAIEAVPLPRAELLQRMEQGDFQIALDYFQYYPKDILRTFYDYFRYGDAIIRRHRMGRDDAEAIRQLRRAARLLRQEDATAIFHRLQELYRRSYTSTVLAYQHHQYYAVNANTVTRFVDNNRLLPLFEWEPVNNP